ncbi:MAG: ATP-binding protein [Candidatus Aminicenantes bacterium]|nr:ATP-binding protein [Candidatus Aminicenantes bacterium]
MRSLRLKLIVGSLLVLGAVVLVFSVLFYYSKRHDLYDVLDGRLLAETQAVARRMEISQGRPAFDAEDDGENRPTIPKHFRIIDERGSILFQSPSPPSFPWPSDPSPAKNPQGRTIESGPAKKAWRVVSRIENLDVDNDTNPAAAAAVAVTIQCAESLGPIREEMEELASRLVLLSIVAFLIAGGGSFLLAGKALRPIRRINQALDNVSETRLDQRLNPAGFDRELHPLIGRLNAAFDRLERAFGRERQFTADASHELRTPLAAIINSIEVLLRRPRSTADLIDGHEENLRTARSMQAIIEGLLLLARMDAGKAAPAKQTIRLASLVREIFAAVESAAREKKVCLSLEIEPETIITADPDQIRLALGNLIENAVRYNRPDGKVTVGAAAREDQTVVTIADTGPGIPAGHLPRIFERFYRLDPSRTETTGGCGLGLSIVQKIVEAHGGRVSASSGPGGSIFTVALPNE